MQANQNKTKKLTRLNSINTTKTKSNQTEHKPNKNHTKKNQTEVKPVQINQTKTESVLKPKCTPLNKGFSAAVGNGKQDRVFENSLEK